jgi:hypothetical protein
MNIGVNMRKRFTKIICVITAVISSLCVGFAAACSDYKSAAVTKDTTQVVDGTNGGFLVQTGDYVYFVNGKATYTDDNTYGDVVKGSIQRISKKNLADRNYTDTETIVPLVAYSGYYDSGIYIYGDYIYYATPSTDKNSDGEIQNQKLEFKRSKLDGSETMRSYYYQASSNSIAYRYVQVDNVVYLVYALSESLYGSSTTNIHSVNTETGTDTLLAYNVSAYIFDSEDLENPYVYYTMSVTNHLGTDNEIDEDYNQIYRVKADSTTSLREYKFDDVTDYDADTDPLYVNKGEFVLDGIGIIAGNNQDRVTQYNYNYENINNYTFDHSDYSYTLKYYQSGKLIFTRSETIGGSDTSSMYTVDDSQLTSSWDAITANDTTKDNSVNLLLTTSTDTEYTFTKINGVDKVVYVGSDGIYVGKIENGKLSDDENVSFIVSEISSAEILAIREETTSDGTKHLYAYYNGTPKSGTAGYYRIAIDGTRNQYERNKLPVEENLAYTDVQILDISVASDWYSPEFVDGQLIFASSTEGMSSYNYIMSVDLRNADGNLMTNAELKAYTEKYNAVLDKIDAYDEEENTDGTQAYENLSSALQYLFYAGVDEKSYLDELIQAYVDIQGKDVEYIYSTASVEKYGDFAEVKGDWADYATDYNTINGKKVYANTQAYYYSVVGQVTSDDAEGIVAALRSSTSLKDYPESDETWWSGLSTVAKVFFIIGMVVAGLLVIGGVTVLVIFLVRRKKGKTESGDKRMNVDITDEKNVDVYADENAKSEENAHDDQTDGGEQEQQ